MDILAGFIELLSMWLVGNKKKVAFVTFSISNFIWIYVAIHSHIYGLLIVCIPAILINLRNYLKWSRDEIFAKKE